MENTALKERFKKPTLYAIILAVIAAALYLPTLTAGLVYDDTAQILTNNYIHNPSHFIDVLTLSSMKKDILDNNRPVMVLSLMLDAMLWGRNPVGYHLTNLLLHALNALLLFWVIYKIFVRLFPQNSKNIGPLPAAFAAVLLFTVHPANSEAVCVVTFREDLLATFFTLLVLILAEVFPSQKISTNLLLGVMITFFIFAAAAAKENGVIAPLFLFAYWLIVRRHTQWRSWTILITASFFAVLVFMIARFTFVPSQSVVFTGKALYLGGSFSQMLNIQPLIWTFQLLELIWPKLLCADHTPSSISFITPSGAFVTLAGVIVIVALFCWKNKGFFLGTIFCFLAMLPTSNLVPIYNPVADRYLYLPMIGICMALGAIICRLKIPTKPLLILTIIAAAAVYIFLSSFTIQRVRVWHNSLSLWQDTITKNPTSATGYDNLGFALYDAGEYRKAVPIFKRACELGPHNADPFAGLAITYDALGQTTFADEVFRKAVSLNKTYANYDSLMQTLLWEPRQAKKLQLIAERVFKR